jgi:hypothetical protein
MCGGLFFCTTYIKKEIKFLMQVPLGLRKECVCGCFAPRIARAALPHALQGLQFQENFAYAAYGPGFTEKLRMGLRAAAPPNSNTSSISFAI